MKFPVSRVVILAFVGGLFSLGSCSSTPSLPSPPVTDSSLSSGKAEQEGREKKKELSLKPTSPPLFQFQGGTVYLHEYKDFLLHLFGKQYLNDFIDEKLVQWKARALEIEVSPQEVEEFVGKRFGRLVAQAGGRDRLIEQLKARGLTLETLLQNLRRNAPTMIQLEKILRKERLRPEILQKAYEQKFGPKVKVRLLYYSYSLAYEEEARKRAKAKAQKVYEKLTKQKLSFEEAAKLYSDASSAQKGGSLGWLSLSQLTSEKVRQQVERLQPGEVSPVVEVPYGYHILYLKDRRGKFFHLYHIFFSNRVQRLSQELRASLRKRLFQRLEKLYQKLKKGKVTFQELFISSRKDYLTEEASFRRYASNYGRAVEAAAFSLKKGEVSPPVDTERAVYLIQLVAKEPPLRPFDEACRRELCRIVQLQEIEEDEILRLKRRLRQEARVKILWEEE